MNYQSEKKTIAEVEMLLDNQIGPVGSVGPHNRRLRSVAIRALASASLLVLCLAAVFFGHSLGAKSASMASECAAIDNPTPVSSNDTDISLHADWRVTIFDESSCSSGYIWNKSNYDVINCIPVPPSIRGLAYQKLTWYPASPSELFKLCTYSATGCPADRLIAATNSRVTCNTAGYHVKSMKVVRSDQQCN